jgi:thiol-disulfide isomerase/thioredoxin
MKRCVNIRRSLVPIVLVATAQAAVAQMREPDPAAVVALAEVVEAYRERPALTVRSVVYISVLEGDMSSQTMEKEAEITIGARPDGVVKLNDFTVTLHDGEVHAVHESTPDKYFSTPDAGSPYYTLMSLFLDIPFPHLAMAWGEEEIEFLCMQFHQKAPWVQPTAVEDVVTGDGRNRRRIMLTSDYSTMRVDVDPESKLIREIDLRITGGDFVRPGAELHFEHEFEYDEHDAPLDPATFVFEPGDRQPVDVIGGLINMPEPRPGGPPGGGELVGKPAPAFVLETTDGAAIDLEDLRGQVIVLDFWATWCGPCRKALPELHELAVWAAREQLPVTVLTVNCFEVPQGPDDSPEARLEPAREFWKENGFTLPILMDYTDEVAKSYGVAGIPATIVIRSDGVVHAQHVGAAPDYQELLKKEIGEAIAEVEVD